MKMVSCFILTKIFIVENFTHILQKDIETISFEFSLRNRKWLGIGLYKPNQNENVFLDYLSK